MTADEARTEQLVLRLTVAGGAAMVLWSHCRSRPLIRAEAQRQQRI